MKSTKTNAFLQTTVARLPALVGVVLSFVTPAKYITPLAVVLIVISLLYIIVGLVRKHLKTPKQVMAYTLIVVSLSVLSIYAIILGSPTAYYLLAVGFLGHAAWDTYQFIKNKVMPRWFSEFCMAYDTLIAVMLVVIGLSK